MRKLKTCLLVLFVIFGSLVAAQKTNNTQTKWTIQNCVNQFSKDKAIPTNAGYQYWFADPDFLNGRTLKLSVVKAHDATHPPHKHMEDEFFFVLEGKAKFYLNGETIVCGQYTSLYCPSMVEHGISNAGDNELKYLVIKDYQAEK